MQFASQNVRTALVSLFTCREGVTLPEQLEPMFEILMIQGVIQTCQKFTFYFGTARHFNEPLSLFLLLTQCTVLGATRSVMHMLMMADALWWS